MSEAVGFFQKCIEIQKKSGDKKGIATSLRSIANFYRLMGENNQALRYFEQSLQISREIQDKEDEAKTLYFIGWVYDNKGDVSRAIDYYNMSLKIQEQTGNKTDLANTLNNIAYIYNSQGNTKMAIDYYTKSLKINEEIKNIIGIAVSLNNIGNIYYKLNDLSKALKYYNASYLKFKSLQYKSGVGYTLNNLGNVYYKKGNIEKAFEYYNNSLTVRTEIMDKQGISITSTNLAEIYYNQNKLSEAEKKAAFGLRIAQGIDYPEGIRSASGILYRIYEKQNNGLRALEMHKLYIQMRDSINNLATQKAVITQYTKHIYEKKSAEDSVRVAEEKKLTAVQLKQEKTQRYTLYGGLVLVLVFSGFMYNRFKISQKQKHIIEKQKEVVDEKQKEILESISYAKRLQEAILPSHEFIRNHVPDNFIFYNPKDIVAGDFYWAEKAKDLFFISAADSTGHGVPGAMVSVVCSNALNRAVKEFHLTETGKILDKTRELVLETFEKSTDEVKDGMDISLLCIDSKHKKIYWSGANNPLWYIKNNELLEIKPDKQPIGKTDYPKPFITHEITFETGLIFYLFTDGFADQFGGPDGKKFKYKQLKEILVSASSLSLQEQKQVLGDSLNNWKGNLEQVDDICFIGLKV